MRHLIICVIFAFALLSFFDIATVVADNTTVVVQTPYGSITGTKNIFGGYSFLGVPFARPPVGSLRFQPPSELPLQSSSSSSLTNISQYKPMCEQTCTGGGLPTTGNFTCSPAGMSEDCLYLNIYVPRGAFSSSLLPVLVYFYGGAYMDGTSMADEYDGSYWSVTQNMIIVAPNYRLNIFGALQTSAPNSRLNGNQCLKDQRMALKFVNRVIGNFGGDVTRPGI